MLIKKAKSEAQQIIEEEKGLGLNLQDRIIIPNCICTTRGILHMTFKRSCIRRGGFKMDTLFAFTIKATNQ